MRKAYVAAPFRRQANDLPGRVYGELTNQPYMSFLISIEDVLRGRGFDVCLPHRDEGSWGHLYYDPGLVTRRCFERIRGSDLVVALPEKSRGVHVELGYAAALGKRVVVFLRNGEEESTLLPGILEVTPSVIRRFELESDVPDHLVEVLDEFDVRPEVPGRDDGNGSVRVGLIDIGSNTTKLIIAEKSNGEFHVLERTARSESRLAEGLYPDRMLGQDAMTRTAAIVSELRDQAEAAGARYVAAVSTGAAREASNASEFVEACRTAARLDVEILTSDREAELLHVGVLSDFDSDLDTFVVLNIGGVSTEITVGTKHQPVDRMSLPLGALTLTERFLTSDPAGDTAHRAIVAAVDAALRAVPTPEPSPPFVLVHTGGELDYLFLTGCPLWPSSYSASHPVQTDPATFRTFAERMRSLNKEELRAFMPGNPRWMDGAIASNAITEAVCAHFKARVIVPSNKNLTDGLLRELSLVYEAAPTQ